MKKFDLREIKLNIIVILVIYCNVVALIHVIHELMRLLDNLYILLLRNYNNNNINCFIAEIISRSSHKLVQTTFT